MIRDKFKDPSPILHGAPSTRQSGIRFKSPSVDSPTLQLSTDINSNIASDNVSDFNPNGFDRSAISGNSSYVNPNTGDVQRVGESAKPSNIDSKQVNSSNQLRVSSEKLNSLRGDLDAPNVDIKYGSRTKSVKLRTEVPNIPTSDQVRESSLNSFK